MEGPEQGHQQNHSRLPYLAAIPHRRNAIKNLKFFFVIVPKTILAPQKPISSGRNQEIRNHFDEKDGKSTIWGKLSLRFDICFIEPPPHLLISHFEFQNS